MSGYFFGVLMIGLLIHLYWPKYFLALILVHLLAIHLISLSAEVDIPTKTGALVRSSVFQSSGLLNASAFRRLLLFGATPHQATFFGLVPESVGALCLRLSPFC